MFVRILGPDSIDTIQCDRVKTLNGEVSLMRGTPSEVVATFANGEGMSYYIMNDQGATIDAWRGTPPAPA